MGGCDSKKYSLYPSFTQIYEFILLDTITLL